MVYLWMLFGITAMELITADMSMCWGRGHLGVEQSKRHYLDECESMSRWPLM
jgi:hypothetical protein